MTALEQIEQLLADMTPAEKAQVLQRVVHDAAGISPGIESNPNISGGEPCIVRTRIPVWILVHSRNLGISEAELLRSYPTLRAEDLVNAWAYYRLHHDEIEQQIADNEAVS